MNNNKSFFKLIPLMLILVLQFMTGNVFAAELSPELKAELEANASSKEDITNTLSNLVTQNPGLVAELTAYAVSLMPQQSAAIVETSVSLAPQAATEIAVEAAKQAPEQAAIITVAAVNQAKESGVPEPVVQTITNSVANALPDQADNIRNEVDSNTGQPDQGEQNQEQQGQQEQNQDNQPDQNQQNQNQNQQNNNPPVIEPNNVNDEVFSPT